MDSILASLGISLASEELQEALQKISPDGERLRELPVSLGAELGGCLQQ